MLGSKTRPDPSREKCQPAASGHNGGPGAVPARLYVAFPSPLQLQAICLRVDSGSAFKASATVFAKSCSTTAYPMQIMIRSQIAALVQTLTEQVSLFAYADKLVVRFGQSHSPNPPLLLRFVDGLTGIGLFVSWRECSRLMSVA
jgi:hypothetical protein